MSNKKSFLMVTLDGGGNLPPMFGLARRLKARGHRVRVLTEPCLQEAVEKQGFTFVPFTEYFTRTDRTEDIFKDSKAGPMANPTLDNVVFGPAKTVAEQTLKAIRQQPTDAVLADLLLPSALIAAEASNVPGVIVFHMPEYLPGRNRPPGMMGLNPGKGALGRLRDRAMGGLFNFALKKYQPTVNATRKEYGLDPVRRVADLFHRADLRLIQTVRAFDFPLDPAPANVRYTGPILDDPDWTATWTPPWDASDRRPLVVVSLSSTFQNQGPAIANAIKALGGLDVRGLVTLGPAMEAERFDAPDNVTVVASAPHSLVFPDAAAVITHAGHGTLMRALSHGLPVLCMPMGRDQNDNAAKVAFHGCGLKLSPKADAKTIRNAMTRLLSEDAIREKARQLGDQVVAASKADTDVRDLEKL